MIDAQIGMEIDRIVRTALAEDLGQAGDLLIEHARVHLARGVIAAPRRRDGLTHRLEHLVQEQRLHGVGGPTQLHMRVARHVARR